MRASRIASRLHSTGRERKEPAVSRHVLFTTLWRPRKDPRTPLDVIMQMTVERIQTLLGTDYVAAQEALDTFKKWAREKYFRDRWRSEMVAWIEFRIEAKKAA